MEKRVTVINEHGLHARPAGILVKAVGTFKSTIELQTDKKTVNARSLMSVMALGLTHGAEVTLIAKGEDEALALETLSALFAAKFE
ncbi:MAG: HPr family phosphocarrier protein [Oligoflexia bacterium]|nr:HPr family phosphocarrier protein [Oligoflexia bacterium]MBF0367125.1 HPr family phosphocarrier protein [Oligoflexia bacterium]